MKVFFILCKKDVDNLITLCESLLVAADGDRNNEPNQNMTAIKHRTVSEIESDIKVASIKRNSFRKVINEGQGGYIDDSDIEALSAELSAARSASSPLTVDLAIERAWFNGQGFGSNDLAAANVACLARGYSLADLQAACKAAK